MKLFRIRISLVAIILASLTSHAFADIGNPIASEEIPKLLVVHEGLFRSGRPDSVGLSNLVRTQQIKTIINLENEMEQVAQEEQTAKQLGVNFVSVPINPYDRPTDSDIEQILSVMQDSRELPMLVHCRHGEDRTGLLVGLYRVRAMGWTPANAYAEMKKLGFHSILRGLDRYFKDKTSQYFLNLFLEQ